MTTPLFDLLQDSLLLWTLLFGATAGIAALPWSASQVRANALAWATFGSRWSSLARLPVRAEIVPLPEIDWDTPEASTAC